jgi:DNA (cytosine-5)-methyltransferase 1
MNRAPHQARKGTPRLGVRPGRSPSDLAGWHLHPKERQDFYRPPRAFSNSVTAWRRRLTGQILAGKSPLSAPTALGEASIRVLLDEGIAQLREVARILAAIHGTPDLGNKKDPVDELVYIVLSRKTREDAYQSSFERIKASFSSWDELLKSPRRKVAALIRSGGLSGRKCDSLYGCLSRLVQEFGHCTLDPAKSWSDERLLEFLCSLPEISLKSAYCIMMYAFGRKVFPVDTHVGRVLGRLGPYREFGFELLGLDHKELQAILADLVPPDLRYSLHVNLVAHGRTACPAASPACETCEIRKFCRHFRSKEVARVTEERKYDVVDLFCGAGGLSLGFERAGFRTSLALDRDPAALRTFRLNHPSVPEERVLCRPIESIAHGELKKLLGRKAPSVLLGAPPCQGFSHAGFRSKATRHRYFTKADARNDLFAFVITAAVELKPRLVLLENVPGMQSAKRANLSYMEEAALFLQEAAGYQTEIWKLNAAEFGVPQDRARHFIVASRTRLLPLRPAADYQSSHFRDADMDALPSVTLDEAIYDLPRLRAGEGEAVQIRESAPSSEDPRSRRYLRKFGIDGGTRILFNHAARYHNERDIELYTLLAPGEDSVHAIDKHGRGDLMRYRRDVFDDKYLKLRPDAPCKTIVSHLAKDGNGFVHPNQSRSITLREAARVQSFADDHPFCGSPTEQWVQLGNAVPPVMASAIARSFLRVLEGEDRR